MHTGSAAVYLCLGYSVLQAPKFASFLSKLVHEETKPSVLDSCLGMSNEYWQYPWDWALQRGNVSNGFVIYDLVLSDAWQQKLEQVATFPQLLDCIYEFKESVACLLSISQAEYIKVAPTAPLLPVGRAVVYRVDEHQKSIEVCLCGR